MQLSIYSCGFYGIVKWFLVFSLVKVSSALLERMQSTSLIGIVHGVPRLQSIVNCLIRVTWFMGCVCNTSREGESKSWSSAGNVAKTLSWETHPKNPDHSRPPRPN